MGLLIPVIALAAVAMFATRASAAKPTEAKKAPPALEVKKAKKDRAELRKERRKIRAAKKKLREMRAKMKKAKKRKVKARKVPTAPTEKPTGIGPQQAAKLLQSYMIVKKTIGYKNNPTIKKYQGLMEQLVPDGIVGPKTRARAKALGVTLPSLTLIRGLKKNPAKAAAAKKKVVKSTVAKQAKAAKAAPAVTGAKAAALRLRNYLATPGANWGTRARPSATVRAFQKEAGITADGIYGPKTRSAAARYGVLLPRRGAKVVPTPTPTPKPYEIPPAAQRQVPYYQIPLERDPKAAAIRLRDYLKTPGANFGTRARPSEQVKAFQKEAGITADGIYGPNTRAAAAKHGIYLPRRK